MRQAFCTSDTTLTRVKRGNCRHHRYSAFWIVAFALLLMLPTLPTLAWGRVIHNYRAVFIPCFSKDQKTFYVAIRAFEGLSNRTRFLVVDTRTLQTSVVDPKNLIFRKPTHGMGIPGYITSSELQATRYMRAVNAYTDTRYLLKGKGGLSHSEAEVKGAFLTIDLDPSVAKFDKKFFEQLAEQSSELEEPIPIAVSVSGLWMLNHRKEFQWLHRHNHRFFLKRLNITWVNHSYSHLYFPDLPEKQNFLLWSRTNLKQEILENERLLLRWRETPSIFFRFPGLVSDEQSMQIVRQLGLIPISADAGLAKKERPQNGSIILIHGNGNDPTGIKEALPLLNQFNWLPIDQAIAPL